MHTQIHSEGSYTAAHFFCVCEQRRPCRVYWSAWHVRPSRPLSTWRGSRRWPNSLLRSSTSLCALTSWRSAELSHTHTHTATQYTVWNNMLSSTFWSLPCFFLSDENSCNPERLQLLQKNHQSKPDKQHEREFGFYTHPGKPYLNSPKIHNTIQYW